MAGNTLPVTGDGTPRALGVFGFTLAAVAVLFLPVAAYANRGVALLLTLCGLAAFWEIVRRRQVHWPLRRGTTIGLGFFFIWSALSASWAETAGLVGLRLGQVGGLALAGIAVLAAVPRLDRRGRMIVGNCATLGVVLFFVLVAADSGLHGAMEIWVRLTFGLKSIGEWLPARFKVAVSVCGIVLPILMLWNWRQGRWWMAAVLPACLMGCALITDSRTGLLAAVVAGIVLLAALAVPRVVGALLAGLIVVSFLAAPFAILRLPPVMTLAEVIPALPNSMMHRLGIWRFTAEHVVERPWLGWGFDASRELPGGDKDTEIIQHSNGKLIATAAQALPLHPHNLMLQVWLELGFGGVAAAVGTALSLIAGVLRSRSMAPAAMGAMAAVFVVGAASFGAWQAWWLSSQWLFAVLCLVLLADRDDGLSPR